MSETTERPATMARPIPSPAVTLETQAFWEAAKEGRFLIKRCTACDQAHWYPRAICPFCASDQTVWEESPGEGVVYTFSIMRRSPSGPYALGYVTLDEGPAVMTNFVDMTIEDLKIGMRVKVRFQETDGGGPPAPVFGPA
jgi:uncharacterized protein